jgi:hypothetical protein
MVTVKRPTHDDRHAQAQAAFLVNYSPEHLRATLMSSRPAFVSPPISPEQEEEERPLLKTIKMGGLQIYINPVCAGLTGEPVAFYSRRAGGPFYRWSFEEESGRWRFSRVRPSLLTLRGFCAANWKIVPPELRARLDAHYME